MKIFIVMPTYNERENMEKMIPALKTLFEQNQLDGHVLVVDDNSPDGTAEVVEAFQEKDPEYIYLLSRSGKLGLGTAYKAGFQKALELGADVIFEMDADFSHDPAMIPIMVEEIGEYDLITGSRRIKGGGVENWGFHRKLTSWGATTLARIVLRLKTKDVTTGYRAYRREILEQLDFDSIKSNGYAFQLELIHRVEKELKGRTKEVPIIFKDRELGKSKLGLGDITEFFGMVFRLRLRRYKKSN